MPSSRSRLEYWDKDTQEILRIAESKVTTWKMAQVEDHILEQPQIVLSLIVSGYTWFHCFIDSFRKETDLFPGMGWHCFQDDVERSIMRARNLRISIFPLHSELEALILIAEQKSMVIFATECSELVKMVSTPTDWPPFSMHLENSLRVRSCLFFLYLVHPVLFEY